MSPADSPELGAPLPYPSRLDEVRVGPRPVLLWRPVEPEAVLDALIEAPQDPDDKMPYWSDLWPSAVALAEAIRAGPVQVGGRRVLELGCGLGLASLVAAQEGAQACLATDWDLEALEYVRASAAANRVAVDVDRLDWRRPPPEPGADLLLAADVLYEARNGPWLLDLCRAWLPGGAELWLSDPGRKWAGPFLDGLKAEGFSVERRTWSVRGPHVPRGARGLLARIGISANRLR